MKASTTVKHFIAYSVEVDTFAAGALLIWLATGVHAFTEPLTPDSELAYLMNFFSLVGTPTPATYKGWQVRAGGGATPEGWIYAGPRFRPKDASTVFPMLPRPAIDLLLQLLQPDRSQRISAQQALIHPWFTADDLPEVARGEAGGVVLTARQAAGCAPLPEMELALHTARFAPFVQYDEQEACLHSTTDSTYESQFDIHDDLELEDDE